ncbi:MAG TPA: pyridoxal-dependent decarboxylase [Chloroflexota bacterium]|nr:pyridoxal-dependent decarboxylase [Chloroflexota bacterium]
MSADRDARPPRAAADWQHATGDMPPEDLRRYGEQIVSWLAGYFEELEHFPVLSQMQPGEIRRALPTSAPESPESMDTILRDFEEIILPGVTHWNHPSFFAYFAITGSAPGILAEMLAAGLNVNAMLWRTSPAATELEMTALDWLRQLIGLPPEFEGVIYDTASISSLVAMAAAREAAGLHIRERGMAGRSDLPPLRLYCSEQAHSSIEKDAITLGIGQEGVRKIPTDDEFRLDPMALRHAIDRDLAAGCRPFCVVATVGTTSTTSIDPVPEIANICQEHGIWLHVDAAYGGAAAIVPEMRWVLAGADRADSLVVNPHKWLFTPVDCSVFYSRRLETVRAAFSLVPAYLQTAEGDAVRDYMNYGPQLGRRFRALKLWFVLRAYGREGIIARLNEHIRLARLFERWLRQDADWEVVAPVPFSTVCFRAHPRGVPEADLDRLNAAIEQIVNSRGRVFLSHTELNGRYILRLAVGNLRTEERHLHTAWDELRAALTSATPGTSSATP